MEGYYVSKAGREKLFQDYQNVLRKKNDAQREMGECAQTDSHLDENPAFQELRVLTMYDLPQRAQELLDKYNRAKIIEEQSEYIHFDGKTVIIGAEVTYLINGREEIFQILGNDEGNIKEKKLGCQAPIALAMLGHKVGETVPFRDRVIKIIAVKKI